MNNRGSEYWYPDNVKSYIIDYLKKIKKRFPDSIVLQEFDKVDIMLLRNIDCIAIEIQKIYIDNKGYVRISEFEDNCRRQIEQNIDLTGKCWLFLDAKFLEYLKNNFNKQISINMKWLYEYYKEGKAEIFSITTMEK